MLTSTINFNQFENERKLQPAFAGPFKVIKLIGKNAVEVELWHPYDRKHPVFPVSLLKLYKSNDEEKFPNRKLSPDPKTELINPEDLVMLKVLDQRLIKRGNVTHREYLVHHKDTTSDYDKWYSAEDMKKEPTLLRAFRYNTRT